MGRMKASMAMCALHGRLNTKSFFLSRHVLGLQIPYLSQTRAGDAARSLPVLTLPALQRPEGRGDEEVQGRAQVDIQDEIQEFGARSSETRPRTPDGPQPSGAECGRPYPQVIHELLR